MLNRICNITFLLMFYISLNAQSTEKTRIPNDFNYHIGVYYLPGAAMDIRTPPNGIKSDPALMSLSQVGLSMFLCFNENEDYGFLFNLGYSVHGNGIKVTDPQSEIYAQDHVYSLTEINLSPMFYYHGLVVGLDIITTSFSQNFSREATSKNTKLSINNDIQNVTPPAEIKIGGMFDLYNSPKSRLCLNLMAGYYLEPLDIGKEKVQNINKVDRIVIENSAFYLGNQVSLSLGLSFYFKVGGY